VEEHGKAALGLVARLLNELDAMVEHPSRSCLEVVDTKEQPNSTCVLAADGIDLSLAVGLSEEQPGLRLRRSDDNPTLRTAIVRGRRRVLNEVEPNASTKNRMVSS
jgi:hypothetical protein